MTLQKPDKPESERRRYRRHAIRATATINYGKTLFPCIVTNLSRGGALVRLFDSARLPREQVQLEARTLGTFAVTVVWQRGEFAGLKFAAEIALKVNPPSEAAA